jgi:hypothetical protein
MNLDLNDLFPPRGFGSEGSDTWNNALFERAWFGAGGPFRRAFDRLSLGFSVLAYVPGNCMSSVASLVAAQIAGREWKNYLEPPGKDSSLGQVWQATPTIVSDLRTWFSPERQGNPPGAIFHNLDFLSDGRGGIHSHLEAQTAVAALVAGTRNGLVLGLSDRDEPELPTAVTRAFDEIVRLDEIPEEDFHRIIPMELGENLRRWGALTTGTVWLMASRLRWLDPIRANRILNRARTRSSVEGILEEIVKSTQTLEYSSPDKARCGQELSGYEAETIELVKQTIIKPFQEWAAFRGDAEKGRRALAKLPPGAVFHGPPGTGKTLLARWIAQEVQLPVRTVSGGEIRAVGYGDAEKNVRRLFREARRAAPCVLILDDADDLLTARSVSTGGTASVERAIVNEFLQQLSGFRGRLEGVLVILTTNQIELLDEAARDRLGLVLRIPYPQSAEAVGKIVDSIADDYDFDLTPHIRERLIERFLQPRSGVIANRDANSNRFSPREIQQAMRVLETWDGAHRLGERYSPTEADIDRMISYYK